MGRHKAVAIFFAVPLLFGAWIFAGCGANSQGQTPVNLVVTVTPTIAPVPRPATKQEIELIRGVATTTMELKSVHTTLETKQIGELVRIESDTDTVSGDSYTKQDVGSKHKEKLTWDGVDYQKDASGRWVEYTGMDEDIHGLQVWLSMMGSPLQFLDYEQIMSSGATETMHGVQVDHFSCSTKSSILDLWVDPRTGYLHGLKLTFSGAGQNTGGDMGVLWTYSKQNEPVDIIKLAGGIIVTPSPTALAVWETGQAISPVCGEWRFLSGGDWSSILGGPSAPDGVIGAASIGGQEVWTTIYQNPTASILRWNRDGWADVVQINDTGELASIAAISPDDVWVVGRVDDPDATPPSSSLLTAHWDGTTWRVVAAPRVDGMGKPRDIAAISSNDVWVAGTEGSLTEFAPLTMHWDGKAWSVVPSPLPESSNRDFPHIILAAVSAVAAGDVWAVGYYTDVDQTRPALTMHWNGAKWQVVSNPVLAELTDVAAIAANDVWAVGSHFDPEAVRLEGIILHWDGAEWKKMPMPAGEQITNLRVVTAISSADVWAAGGPPQGATGPDVALIHWDGRAWSRVTPPWSESVGFEAILPLGQGEVWFGGTVKDSAQAFVAVLTEQPCTGR